MENQIDEKDLKSQALLERISQLTTQYEEQVANLRVALTIVSQERDGFKAQVEEKNVSEDQDSS